jgi:hypothetical protein
MGELHRYFKKLISRSGSHERPFGCSLPANVVEPLSGKSIIYIGNVRESDGHGVVAAPAQRRGQPYSLDENCSPSPRLLMRRSEPEPVHAGNYILSHARCGSLGVRSHHLPSPEDFRNMCGKVCGNRLSFTRL